MTGQVPLIGRAPLPILRRPSLATAEVLYYLPDHPSLLQSFVWQTEDAAPRYPRITAFLDHWRREIDAVIHSVRVATGDAPPDGWRRADLEVTWN